MSRANFADLLKAQRNKEQRQGDEKPVLEIVQSTAYTRAAQPTPRTPPTPPTSAAPERDFTKVANSIVRDAMPNGMFIGKSKQIYDYLYSLTRGAIKPVRTVRITKAKLMKGSGIGSERTLLKNLSHLRVIGLIKITEYEGQHLGNEYEILLPEERQPNPPHPPHPRQAPHSPSKVGTLPPLESGVGGVGLLTENKTTYNDAKTSLKTNTKSDDEAFAAHNEIFIKACEKISGKLTNKNQQGNWRELAELLVMELEVAAARTKSISNVPAFLTEHLRRRLMPVKRETPKGKLTKLAQAGNQETSKEIEVYQPEPLTRGGRESTLKTFTGQI